MKQKSLLIGLLCGFFLLCLLFSLNKLLSSQEDLSDYMIVYNKTPFVLSENPHPIGSSFALNKDMELGERNGIAYIFEPSIPLEERARCIQATEAILARLGNTQSLQLAVYSQRTYDSTFVSGNTIYTCLQNWESPEYVSSLLYGLFGEYCHYGAVYGYANYLCRELFDAPMEFWSTFQYYPGDGDALDLNLLCFRPEYAKDIQSLTQLSNTFVADYIQAKGEAAFHELLKKSGKLECIQEFTQILTEFYAARGFFYTPSQLLFRQGGKSYAYIVKGDYATFYMEKNWVDSTSKNMPMCYDGFLRQNYSEVKQYFTTVLGEMAQYQKLFSLDSYNNDLDVYYTNYHTRPGYFPEYHAFRLPSVNSLSMLYVGSLVGLIIPQEDWAVNGTLAYFSYYYNHYGNTIKNYYANILSDSTNRQDYWNFRQWLGRDIDFFTDYTEFSHHYAYSNGYTHPDKGGSDSFMAYLIHRFGEEAVIDILCRTHDFGDDTFDELVADWTAFLEENYSSPKRVE